MVSEGVLVVIDFPPEHRIHTCRHKRTAGTSVCVAKDMIKSFSAMTRRIFSVSRAYAIDLVDPVEDACVQRYDANEMIVEGSGVVNSDDSDVSGGETRSSINTVGKMGFGSKNS